MNLPKVDGELGVRSSRLNNAALLGKLVEDLFIDNGKIWVKALF